MWGGCAGPSPESSGRPKAVEVYLCRDPPIVLCHVLLELGRHGDAVVTYVVGEASRPGLARIADERKRGEDSLIRRRAHYVGVRIWE